MENKKILKKYMEVIQVLNNRNIVYVKMSDAIGKLYKNTKGGFCFEVTHAGDDEPTTMVCDTLNQFKTTYNNTFRELELYIDVNEYN